VRPGLAIAYGALLTVAATIALVVIVFREQPLDAVAPSRAELGSRPEQRIVISFMGPEEVVIPDGRWGLTHMPDGPLSFIRSNGEIHVWFAGHGGTYYLKGKTLGDVKPYQLNPQGDAVPVLTSSGSGFDSDYAGAEAVVRDRDSPDLLMFYHAENYSLGENCPYVSIGLARSSDGGATWRREGQVLTSAEPPAPCKHGPRFQGAGSFSLVARPDGYFYMYYMEWLEGQRVGIRLARAPIASDGMPGSWHKYKDGHFGGEPGLGGTSDIVIGAPDVQNGYVGVPSVSFNVYLDRYVAIVMGQSGFYYTSSADGTNWDVPELLWSVPVLTDQPRLSDGKTWYYYPSLLSPDRDSQTTTGRTAYLYYARGTKNGPPHYMVRRSVRLDFSSPK
jgi:hypothetical protein